MNCFGAMAFIIVFGFFQYFSGLSQVRNFVLLVPLVGLTSRTGSLVGLTVRLGGLRLVRSRYGF